MSLRTFLQNNPFCRKIILNLGRKRAASLIDDFEHFISPSDKIIDIGAGTCIATSILQERGYQVQPLDVTDISFIDGIQPLLYDGARVPFADDTFDVALILTVLHHTRDHTSIINEARRVARKIVIIEDIFTSQLHKYLTFFLDSVLNLEFSGHPHSNRSDSEWKSLFKELELKLLDSAEKSIYAFFRLGYYFLGK